MSSHDKDKLEQDLAALQRKYRAAARDEPPAMLDQAVLNRARRAAEQHAIRPWSFSWMHATATAALVVLGLTLVLQLRETAQAPETLPEEMLDHIEVPAEAADQDAGMDQESDPRRSQIAAYETIQERQKSEALREVREEVLEPPPASPGVSAFTLGVPAVHEIQDSALARRPEEWLNHILELKQGGDEYAWRSELEMFVSTFPEHPLPKELSEALRAEPAAEPDSG